MNTPTIYQAKNKIRIVTAASLFDGHDAAINVMRRIIQSSGAEVIHLGHDRSVEEVVNCAIQEDANAIAMTSYQGGHNEYFKYMFDLLKEKGASQIRVFGGGGGTILPDEIKELQDYGITKVYHPDDGREMGLQGMINDLLEKCDFPTGKDINQEKLVVNSQERALINLVVNTKYIEVKTSSGGIIKLSGTTKHQDVNLDLYGVYRGFNLKTENTSTVKAGTGAKAEIFAGETLTAKVSFGGSIFYKGNPELIKDKKVIGGIIQKRN